MARLAGEVSTLSLPLSIAMLVTLSASVSVGPPLFCRSPSCGSRAVALELPPRKSCSGSFPSLIQPVLLPVLPIRLWPWLWKIPETSAGDGSRLDSGQ